jgi:hypothetical protein
VPSHSRGQLVHWEYIHQLLWRCCITTIALSLLSSSVSIVIIVAATEDIVLRINSGLLTQYISRVECHSLMHGYPVA